MGSTVVSNSSLPLSTGASNNVISALGLNLQGQTGSSIQYLLTGTAPNQTMVIQWTNYRKAAATGDVFNFQIRLNQNGNSIAVVYNAFTVNATNSTPQVGLRGASSADFNNRTVGASQTWGNLDCRHSQHIKLFAVQPSFQLMVKHTPGHHWTAQSAPSHTMKIKPLNSCWSISQVSGTGLWTMATSINYPDLVPVVTLNPQSGTHLAKFDSYNYVAGTVSQVENINF